MNNHNKEIVIDVWGDYACFTRPESKVERVSYPCPTPSAMRGILNAIYSKPAEFYYQITSVEIMNPIKTISIRKNEFKEKTDANNPQPCYNFTQKGTKGLTQRNNIYLKNVYYRIHAQIIKQPNFDGSIQQLYAQFNRRVEKGKCFYEPCLGTRECLCYFSEPDYEKQPLTSLNEDIGIMLYDVFNIKNNIKLDTSNKNQKNIFQPSFFKATIINGIMNVPKFESDLVFRKEVKSDAQ